MAESRRALRIAAVGLSTSDPCGVRDHATLLADALAAEGVDCSLRWLSRSRGLVTHTDRAEVADWARRLGEELAGENLDAVLWHYSVFSYAWHGVPVGVPAVLGALRHPGRPLVGFLHEHAFPWRRCGLRGKVWALSHRVALAAIMRGCAAIVVTDAERGRWLGSRRWLARRPVAVTPVFSNLPAAGVPAADGAHALKAWAPDAEGGAIGLFGYSHEGVRMELVLDALRLLGERGLQARLLLLGAPGRESAAGERWVRAAGARGLEQPPCFSGMLPAGELAQRLAGCEVLLCADRPGPTPRKTTLAASLASGRPVVALDGRLTWPELKRARAVAVVAPSPEALAGELAGLLADGAARADLGERGSRFAAEHMSVEHSAAVVARAVRGALA
ncbi:MAG TPA: hypothetical protein VL972_00435 [Solirubrobacteraceae bacterium]|nr:hypothetical protein [Solirubrobacteraceae bacterium]